jgi:hypothetical protein
MSSGQNIIVPAVPLAKPESQTPLKTSSSTDSVNLNPDALTFAPGQSRYSKELSVNTSDFVLRSATPSSFDAITDATADKYDALNFAQLESPTVKDLTDPSHQAFGEDVQFVPESGAFVLTCNTQFLPQSSLSFDILSKLVATHNLPHKVQLIVFTGPRFQHIHNVARWFVESMGSYVRTVHNIQIAILRCGEYMSGEWVIPAMDLEKFEPLRNFVAELIQVLPKHADFIWGSSEKLTLALLQHYLLKALPSHQNAVNKDSVESVFCYSESVRSVTLRSIGSEYLRLQGKKTYPMFDSSPSTATYVNTPSLILDGSGPFTTASILNPNASSFTPGTSLGAKSFTPAPVYNRPLPLYTPNLQ